MQPVKPITMNIGHLQQTFSACVTSVTVTDFFGQWGSPPLPALNVVKQQV